MRKFLLIMMIIALASTMLLATDYQVNFNSSYKNLGELNFDFTNYSIKQVEKDGQTFTKINFDKNIDLTKKGFAELPFVHAAVQLDAASNVDLEIVPGTFKDIHLDYPMLPSRGIIYRNQDPETIPYVISPESITDSFYPNKLAVASDPFILRNVRATDIYVYPFQYNAQTQTLRIYKNITVKLVPNNSNPINPLYNTGVIPQEMNSLYKTAFINYNETKFENELAEYGSILVIYTERDADAIAPYIQWKREKGFTVYTEEVATNTTVTDLVQNFYNDHNDLLYVQLVGDWADIKTPYSSAPHDPNLGCVVGNDLYPDLIIGRFSANNPDDVTVQVDKAINYEKNVTATTDWYHSCLGIGSDQGQGNGDDGEMDKTHIGIIIHDKLLPFTYTDSTGVYDPSGNAQQIANAVNEGISIINYCGHGSHTSWGTTGFSNSNINQLQNGNMLPFVFSVACVNGEFHTGGDCFAEAWLKKANGGAVAFIGSTINQSWQPPMRGEDYMDDLLIGGYNYNDHQGQNGMNTDVQKTTFGSITFNGNILMTLEDYSGGQPMMETWTIFGDASLQVRTDTPAEMSISNPAIIFGVDYTTTVTSEGNPVPNALVSICQGENVYSGLTDNNGNITLTANWNVGPCTFTVTAFNKETIYNADANVIPADGPFILLDSVNYSDNNDNVPNYDEDVNISINSHNVGQDTATNASAVLSTEDSNVEITNANASIGDIAANQTIPTENAFTVHIANNIPDQYSVPFTVTYTSGNNTWTSNFNMTVNAPAFEIGNFVVNDADGNNNGLLDPGETANIIIPLNNIGHAISPAIIGNLTSGSDLITIQNGTANASEINPDGTTNLSFTVIVSPDAQTGSVATLGLLVTAGSYTVQSSINVNIGIVMEDFETGDFSSFDWEFGSSPWEISETAPYEGSYCAQSSDISDNGIAEISLSTNVPSDSEISFYYKVSSENNYDFLRFFINDEEMEHWSGDVAWTQATYNVPAGETTFKWQFTKDGSVSGGEDCAWIDQIIFPAIGGDPTPIFGINVTELNFDTINVNETETQEFIISNMGDADLTGNIETPQGFTARLDNKTAGRNSINYSVPANSNITVYIDFQPTEEQEYSGNIAITSNDPNNPTANITVNGTTPNGPNSNIPKFTSLKGNYPNPFNPETAIHFGLKSNEKVSLIIYNIKGQMIRTLINKEMRAGNHSVVWNGKNNSNKTVGSGVYFYKFSAGKYHKIQKMLLLK